MKQYILLIVVLMLVTSLACSTITGDSPDVEDTTVEGTMEEVEEAEQIEEVDAEEVEEAVDTPTPIPPEPTTPLNL